MQPYPPPRPVTVDVECPEPDDCTDEYRRSDLPLECEDDPTEVFQRDTLPTVPFDEGSFASTPR